MAQHLAGGIDAGYLARASDRGSEARDVDAGPEADLENALARARPVSRQHIQVLVNALLEEGLVAAVENPGHRRSPQIALTPAGRKRFGAMRARERRALAKQGLPIKDAELRSAARVLRALREHLAEAWPPRPGH